MTDPATISTEQLDNALAALGIPLADIARVELNATPTGGYLSITRWRRDDDGRIIGAGNTTATVTVVIGIVRPEPAP